MDATTCNGNGRVSFTTLECTCDAAWSPSHDCSTCLATFAGTTCQYSDDTTCHGHGKVSADANDLPVCACDSGYDDALFCASCSSGYAGNNCNETASTQCSNNGVLTTAGDCQCNPQWANSPTCNCCVCAAGYLGAGCAFSSATTCHGHGTVSVLGDCACDRGYNATTKCQSCLTGVYTGSDCAVECPGATFDTANPLNSQPGCNGAQGACRSSRTDAGNAVCSCNKVSLTGNATFKGPLCQYSDEVTCHGNGVVGNSGICECNKGFKTSSPTSQCNESEGAARTAVGPVEYILIGGSILVVCLVLLITTAVTGASPSLRSKLRCNGMPRPIGCSPTPTLTLFAALPIVWSVFASLFDYAVDLALIYRLSMQSDLRFLMYAYCGIMGVSTTANMSVSLVLLRREIRAQEAAAQAAGEKPSRWTMWWQNHYGRLKTSVALFMCVSKVQALSVLTSGLAVPFLGLFDAPFLENREQRAHTKGRTLKEQCAMFGVVGVVLEDIPQLGIQIYILSELNSPPLATYLSTSMTGLSILFAVVSILVLQLQNFSSTADAKAHGRGAVSGKEMPQLAANANTMKEPLLSVDLSQVSSSDGAAIF